MNPDEQFPGTTSRQEIVERGNRALRHWILYWASACTVMILAWVFLRRTEGFVGLWYIGLVASCIPLIRFDSEYGEAVLALDAGCGDQEMLWYKRLYYRRIPLTNGFFFIFAPMVLSILFIGLAFFPEMLIIDFSTDPVPVSPLLCSIPFFLAVTFGIMYYAFRLRE